MPESNPEAKPPLEQKAFILLLAVVSIAFVWILLPFYGAVFWGAVLAIVFAPLFRRFMARTHGRATVSALLTLLVILVLVVLPMALIASALVREATALVERIRQDGTGFSGYVSQIYAALPEWLMQLLRRVGLDDLSGLQQRVTSVLTQGGQRIAERALNLGQNTFDFVVSFFVMLYLLFFLLRDGAAVSHRLRAAIPLESGVMRNLAGKFTTVIRATVKGNIVVAIVQGALGGLAFWVLGIHAPVLWAVLMAFLSLLPAVGAGLVWVPVAIYLLATGATLAGVGLVAYGVLVTGLVDNVLRPLLVGKDTKLPDYVVLISTLGGMALLGINGFVIGPLVAAMFVAVWDIFAAERDRTGAPAPAMPAVEPATRSDLDPDDRRPDSH